MKMGCPVCGSEDIARSHRRSFEKLIKYIYPKRPYRCKECWARFWVWENPFKTWKQIAVAGLVICIIALIFLLPFFLPDNKPKTKRTKISNDRPSYHKVVKKDVVKADIPEKARVSTNLQENEQKPALTSSPIARNQIPPLVSGPKEISSPPAVKTTPSLPGDSAPSDNQVINPPDEKTQADNKAIAENTLPDARQSQESQKPLVPKEIKEVKNEKAPEVTETPLEKQDRLKEDKDAVKTQIAEIPVKSPIAVKPEKNSIEKVKFIKWPRGFKMSMVTAHGVGKYNNFFLDGPPKLVLDIKGKWKLNTDSVFRVRNDLVKQVRIGEHDEFIRIVFDFKTKKPVLPEVTKSDQGLIITIKQINKKLNKNKIEVK